MSALRTVAIATIALSCTHAPTPVQTGVAAPSTAPTAHTPTTEPTPLRVVALRNQASPLVTIRVVFESGSADDPPGQEGITRLAARLMAEGGTALLDYGALTRRLFPMAARVSFTVDRDMTVFVGQVHRDHLAAFYPLFRDVILNPALSDDDFARVRTQTLADLTLDLRGSSDEALGKETLQALIYRDHPYGHPALGTEEGLGAITLDAVRAHRQRVFCQGRVILGLAGGFAEGMDVTLRNDFAALSTACAPRAELPTPARPHGPHVVIVDKPEASATAISIGYPVAYTRADDDFARVQFVTNYLGLHRQSVGVLYQTLREARGLNYGDYAYAEHFAEDVGTRFPRPNIARRQQYASVWIRPVPSRNAHFALRAATRAVQHALDAGVADADIARVRTFLGGYVGLYTQTESTRLGYAIDALTAGIEGTMADRLRGQWASLDRTSLQDAARRNLTTQDVWIAIVAPDARALADALGHDAPSPITYDSPKPAEVVAEDREIATYPLHIRPEDIRVVPLAEVFRGRGL